MNHSTATIKTCPSCGNSFPCQSNDDCWCEKVKIHKKEMLEIMEKYTDCICPDCLKKYEKE
jgi:hypothetical protein